MMVIPAETRHRWRNGFNLLLAEPWRNGNSVIHFRRSKTIQFGGKTEYSYQKVPKTQGKRIRANIVATNATNNTTFVKGQKFFKGQF